MKRVKAIASIADSLAAQRSAVRPLAGRPYRQLSTASAAHYRRNATTSRPATAQTPFRQHTAVKTCKRQSSTAAEPAEELKETPLYELHDLEGAKFVPFGGYQMPVSYEGHSISDSHHFTRSHASVFDVSHMVQHKFVGPGATAFLQRITPAGLTALAPHHSTLSTLLWPGTGGIVDDTIITRLGPQDYYVVTNAGCREKDLKYFKEQLAEYLEDGGEAVEWEVLEDWGLIALQGPLSEEILTSVLTEPDDFDLKDLLFGQSKFLYIETEGGPKLCLVSRGGYTGEDGFEISIKPESSVLVTLSILEAGAGAEEVEADDRVKLAGLAARDSLRLEAGMCLYGHDLDDTVTPVEAGLSWIIGKDRRVEGGFHGADVILQQLVPKSKGGLGVERRRVGFIVEGAPAREGAEIVDDKGEKIGNITSGCPSPTLSKFIAMGYIKDGLHKSGTEVTVMVRGKPRKATVTKMPFVPSKYWKGLAPS
ncbi:glycine cleavage system t protein [Phlyctema vagabunda]|uniref:Aminomethyltransferase n=1 Tax=Phlyctema vagabunda TaxID=108571 RepID=A0ABR4PWS4_9HELO